MRKDKLKKKVLRFYHLKKHKIPVYKKVKNFSFLKKKKLKILLLKHHINFLLKQNIFNQKLIFKTKNYHYSVKKQFWKRNLRKRFKRVFFRIGSQLLIKNKLQYSIIKRKKIISRPYFSNRKVKIIIRKLKHYKINQYLVYKSFK